MSNSDLKVGDCVRPAKGIYKVGIIFEKTPTIAMVRYFNGSVLAPPEKVELADLNKLETELYTITFDKINVDGWFWQYGNLYKKINNQEAWCYKTYTCEKVYSPAYLMCGQVFVSLQDFVTSTDSVPLLDVAHCKNKVVEEETSYNKKDTVEPSNWKLTTAAAIISAITATTVSLLIKSLFGNLP